MSDCIWVGANVFGKRAEVFNAIHAMALVDVDPTGAPLFVGQGNMGFAPFGTGRNASEKIADGRFRLHLLTPLTILSPQGLGEGLVFAQGLRKGPDDIFDFPFPNPGFPFPRLSVDVTVTGRSDLLLDLHSEEPAPVIPGPVNFNQLEADKTVSGTTFVDLVGTDLHVDAEASEFFTVIASASVECNDPSATVDFRITLDGSPLGPGSSFTVPDGPDGGPGKGTISIVEAADVSAGDHTVMLQWRTSSTDATASIFVTNPEKNESASLEVKQESREETDRETNFPFQVIVFRFPPRPGTR
jgi:hypothetical protein